MKTITIHAPAKINLGLDVLRKRTDGYHDVKMIMQTVGIFDDITITKTEEPGIRLQADHPDIPTDDSNLICKAAKLFLNTYSIKNGVQINLVKRIPVAAGMAGGSTDAASTLLGLNQLFDINASIAELQILGVKIGADVPYCILQGTALSEGIGEKLTILKSAPECYLVIAKPPIFVSTKYVYDNLHANELAFHPDIDSIRDAIEKGNLAGMADKLENVLETVTTKEYPVIDRMKNILKEQGALNAIMSGSGPTVFGIFDDREKAEAGFRAIIDSGLSKEVYQTGFYNPETTD